MAGLIDAAELRAELTRAHREGRVIVQAIHDQDHDGEPDAVCSLVQRLDGTFAFLAALDDDDLAREFWAWATGSGLHKWLMDMSAVLQTEV